MRKHGTDVQNRRSSLCPVRCAQPRQAFAREFGRSKEIDLHDPSKTLFASLIKSSYGTCTGVVDEYIQFSPMSVNPLTDGMSVKWVSKITRERLK